MFRKILTAAVIVAVVTTSALARAKEPATYFAYRSFWPEHETMKRFADAGVHTFCVFPSNTSNSLGEPYSRYPNVWRYPDVYDWDALYRQFDEIVAFDPDARFICMVDLNTPTWLARSLGMLGDGSFDSFVDLSNCLALPQWRTATEKYLVDFLEQVEARYGNRVDAYVLACGQTDEWMDYSAYRPSRAKNAAYAKWRRDAGLPDAPWPALAEFDHAAFENRVRDPQREANVLDAVRFEQELVADAIIETATLAKGHIAVGKEIGVFFGYILELTGWRANGCGHLAYERVMASDAVDFFISPGTYSERLVGGGSGSMAPNETILLSRKRRLHETDHRTTTYNCALNEFVGIAPIARWQSDAENVAGLRRELALALIDRASIWFFDMWGGSFDFPGAMENVATMKRVWDRNVGRQGETTAEILLVVDPQSAARVNDREPQSTAVYHALRNRLNHVGAPFAVCSFNDLEKIDLSKVKLAILPGSFTITPERRATLRERLLRDDRVVLWLGPAGIDDGSTLDVARVSETTGADYGADSPNATDRVGFFGDGAETWRSVALSRHDDASVAFLRQTATDAGVVIYVDDEAPVYASERLVAVHVAKGGVRKITLPRKATKVTEAFSQKVVAENTDSFEYDFAEPETALFELEF